MAGRRPDQRAVRADVAGAAGGRSIPPGAISSLGFTHILPYGLDHVLFVLGIYLLSGRARSVLWQVSAFTVAHSITLGLSMYGVIAVSPRCRAADRSLDCLRRDRNMFLSELKSWRVALVFASGCCTAWASRECSRNWGCRARNS